MTRIIPLHRNLSLWLLWVCLAPSLAGAGTAHDTVEKGNTFYRQQQYEEANQAYTSAAEQRPDAPEISFNQGNVAFQEQDYAKALSTIRAPWKRRTPPWKAEPNTILATSNISRPYKPWPSHKTP